MKILITFTQNVNNPKIFQKTCKNAIYNNKKIIKPKALYNIKHIGRDGEII